MSKSAIKGVVNEHLSMIRRINDQRIGANIPKFKIVDGISCGNCTHFAAERCTIKRKSVKEYNICEKHNASTK